MHRSQALQLNEAFIHEENLPDVHRRSHSNSEAQLTPTFVKEGDASENGSDEEEKDEEEFHCEMVEDHEGLANEQSCQEPLKIFQQLQTVQLGEKLRTIQKKERRDK